LVFAVVLALFTVMLFGLWPALRACRCEPYEAIKSNVAKGAGSSFRFGLGGRAALVVTQVGLAFVLLTGAGLMLRSFAALLNVPIGFDPAGLLTFQIDLPRQHYDDAAVGAFYQRLTARLSAAPGVESVAVTSTVPLRGNREVTMGTIDGVVEAGDTAVHMVTPAFFETLRILLRQGRLLNGDDRVGTRHVALINESAARRFWPAGNAIGSRIALGLNGWSKPEEQAEIVGVVGDAQYQQVESPIGVNVYLSSLQRGHSTAYFAMRTGGDPEVLIAAVRSATRELDATLPIYEIATGEQVVADATSKTRFSSALLGVFAALALLLAAAGVYAVVSYSAAARTPEIGVRQAMGAEPGSVVRLMMRDVALLCLAGLALGAVAALAATRLLAGSLYAVQPNDLATFAVCAALLLGLSLLACYLPARRASRIDPLAALRYE
jgi:predicted permease